jgi:hypothetical protein
VGESAGQEAFFVGLGLEVEGTRIFVEGEFLDTVIGIAGSRIEIVMLRPPDGGTRLELSSFVRPDHQPESPTAMANELGLRNLAASVPFSCSATKYLRSSHISSLCISAHYRSIIGHCLPQVCTVMLGS